jgi:hypothetical protein
MRTRRTVGGRRRRAHLSSACGCRPAMSPHHRALSAQSQRPPRTELRPQHSETLRTATVPKSPGDSYHGNGRWTTTGWGSTGARFSGRLCLQTYTRRRHRVPGTLSRGTQHHGKGDRPGADYTHPDWRSNYAGGDDCVQRWRPMDDNATAARRNHRSCHGQPHRPARAEGVVGGLLMLSSAQSLSR